MSFVVGALMLFCIGPARPARGQEKPEFWIGAIDPVVQQDRKIANPADYMELFKPPTMWLPVLSAVKWILAL